MLVSVVGAGQGLGCHHRPRVSTLHEWRLLASACPGCVPKASHLTAAARVPCCCLHLAGGALFTHLLPDAACISGFMNWKSNGKGTRELLNLTFWWRKWVALQPQSWTRPWDVNSACQHGPSGCPALFVCLCVSVYVCVYLCYHCMFGYLYVCVYVISVYVSVCISVCVSLRMYMCVRPPLCVCVEDTIVPAPTSCCLSLQGLQRSFCSSSCCCSDS